MPNHILIYVIVALNALCQIMLIWRLKLAQGGKYLFCCLTLLLPTVIAIIMRLAVASGLINARLELQTVIERSITSLAGIFLIASPWLVTLAALLYRKKVPNG